MPTPARILRAMAQDRDPWPDCLTDRQAKCRERILAISQHLMAEHGRHSITFSSLAIALRIATATLRFHFADLDALLGEILSKHLHALAAAMTAIPHDAPDRMQARRAAYFAYTHGPFGGLTEAHLLLVRDRHLLPADELRGIELTRQSLGILLSGDLAQEALLLLDAPYLDIARIEARLAPLPQAPARAPERQPAAAAMRRQHPMPRPALVQTPGPPTPAPAKNPGDRARGAGVPFTARAPPEAA